MRDELGYLLVCSILALRYALVKEKRTVLVISVN